MAKLYSGGIEIATGFKQLSPVLIDDRCAVELDSDLDLIENKCKGLISYSDESKTVFFYDGNEWIPILGEGGVTEWGAKEW